MLRANTLLSTLAATGMALPLMSCGSSAHDATELYFLVTANSKIQYWQAAAAGFSQAANDLRVRYDVAGPDTYDPQAERQEFTKVVRQKKPTGILVSAADSELLKPEIDAAVAQGIPVITLDSDSPASKRLMFIGTDNYEAGRRGGAVLARQLQGKGSVVVFTMPEQANLRERWHGYEDALKASPAIKVVETVDVKGDPRISFDRTMEFVEKKKPVDAFVCLEALACPEVADVLDRKQVKGKVIIAMDTDPRTLEWIQKGMIAATLAQRPYTMAYFGLKVLDMLHHQKPPSLLVNWSEDTRSPFPSFVDTGATLVDKQNVDAFVKANAAAPPASGS
jgi:ribose transport system substrate-binding protein